MMHLPVYMTPAATKSQEFVNSRRQELFSPTLYLQCSTRKLAWSKGPVTVW